MAFYEKCRCPLSDWIFVNVAGIIFLSHFWPLGKKATHFVAAQSLAEIGLSLYPNHYAKLCLSKLLIDTVRILKRSWTFLICLQFLRTFFFHIRRFEDCKLIILLGLDATPDWDSQRPGHRGCSLRRTQDSEIPALRRNSSGLNPFVMSIPKS